MYHVLRSRHFVEHLVSILPWSVASRTWRLRRTHKPLSFVCRMLILYSSQRFSRYYSKLRFPVTNVTVNSQSKGLSTLFEEIVTNPAEWDPSGLLKLRRKVDPHGPQHACKVGCSPNMCKGSSESTTISCSIHIPWQEKSWMPSSNDTNPNLTVLYTSEMVQMIIAPLYDCEGASKLWIVQLW